MDLTLHHQNPIYKAAVNQLATELQDMREFRNNNRLGGRPRQIVGEYRTVDIRLGFERPHPQGTATQCKFQITREMMEDAEKVIAARRFTAAAESAGPLSLLRTTQHA